MYVDKLVLLFGELNRRGLSTILNIAWRGGLPSPGQEYRLDNRIRNLRMERIVEHHLISPPKPYTSVFIVTFCSTLMT